VPEAGHEINVKIVVLSTNAILLIVLIKSLFMVLFYSVIKVFLLNSSMQNGLHQKVLVVY